MYTYMYMYICVIHNHEHFTEPDTCTLQKSPKYMFCPCSTFLFISNYHSEQIADKHWKYHVSMILKFGMSRCMIGSNMKYSVRLQCDSVCLCTLP